MFCCLQAVVWTQIAAWKWNQSLILKWVYSSRDNKHQCLFLCLQIGTEGIQNDLSNCKTSIRGLDVWIAQYNFSLMLLGFRVELVQYLLKLKDSRNIIDWFDNQNVMFLNVEGSISSHITRAKATNLDGTFEIMLLWQELTGEEN